MYEVPHVAPVFSDFASSLRSVYLYVPLSYRRSLLPARYSVQYLLLLLPVGVLFATALRTCAVFASALRAWTAASTAWFQKGFRFPVPFRWGICCRAACRIAPLRLILNWLMGLRTSSMMIKKLALHIPKRGGAQGRRHE